MSELGSGPIDNGHFCDLFRSFLKEIGFVQNVDQSSVPGDSPLGRDRRWKVTKKWKRAWKVTMKLMMKVRVRRKSMR